MQQVLAGARVLLVEDDPDVALVVTESLEESGCDVTHAACVRDATGTLHREFDVAVLDVGLPDGKGFDVLEALRRLDAPCCAVMMTGDPTDTTVAHSIAAGVSEFLAKPFTGGQLTGAVVRALGITREWRVRLKRARADGIDGDGTRESGAVASVAVDELELVVRRMVIDGGLTEREAEIMQLILAGLQNADIAGSLGISANTVKYHVRNMLTKLGLESRTELFRTLLHERGED